MLLGIDLDKRESPGEGMGVDPGSPGGEHLRQAEADSGGGDEESVEHGQQRHHTPEGCLNIVHIRVREEFIYHL